MGIGRTSLRQATTKAHTIHEVAAPQHYMGVDPGVGPVLWISRNSSYLHNPTQTTDQEPKPTAAYIEIYPWQMIG